MLPDLRERGDTERRRALTSVKDDWLGWPLLISDPLCHAPILFRAVLAVCRLDGGVSVHGGRPSGHYLVDVQVPLSVRLRGASNLQQRRIFIQGVLDARP